MSTDRYIWKCTCGNYNDWNADFCDKCRGRYNTSRGDVKMWRCSTCGSNNSMSNNTCVGCKGKFVAP